MTSERRAFITGFPGAAATRVATDYLSEPDTVVSLLVDKPDAAGAEQFCAPYGERIEILVGSPTRIDFGLAGTYYMRLADTVSLIACLDLPHPPGDNQDEHRHRKAAREILELAQIAPNLEHVMVLSHFDVSGSASGNFAERDLDVGQGFPDPGAQDRFAAERIYRRFCDTIPLTVVRTGWVVGGGNDLCPLVQMLLSADDLESQISKHPELVLRITPIEQIEAVLPRLLTMPPTRGGLTLHLAPAKLSPLPELAADIIRAAHKLAPAGFQLESGAKRSMTNNPQSHRWSLRELLKRQPHRVNLSSLFSERYLEQRDFAPLSWGDEALETLVSRALEEVLGFR